MKNDQQKTGILFSLPVCIVATFFVFPIGIILIFMRLYKRGKISKKVKNIGVGMGAAFIGVLVFGLFTLPEVDTPGVAAKPKPSVSEVATTAPPSQDTPSQPPEPLNRSQYRYRNPSRSRHWSRNPLRNRQNLLRPIRPPPARQSRSAILRFPIWSTKRRGQMRIR